jgi:hypothetical protein
MFPSVESITETHENTLGYMLLESAFVPDDFKIINDSIHEGADQQFTSGSKNSVNRVIAEGTLQDADHTNRNGRDYEKQDLWNALKDPRLKELKDTGNLKAENGHPLDKSLQRQQIIYDPLTCAKFLDIWTEGDRIKAKFKGTNNNYGEYFNNDLLDGEKPSWSLRALGYLQNKNGKLYVKNIRIITWDRVIYPSHKCAYTEKICNEEAKLAGYGENQLIYPENWKGEITPITTAKALRYIQQESANLMNVINTFDCLGNSTSIVENGRAVQIITKQGNTLRFSLEKYITNEIMDYCARF